MVILNFGTAMPIMKFGTFKLSRYAGCAPVYGGGFTPLKLTYGMNISFPRVTSPAPIRPSRGIEAAAKAGDGEGEGEEMLHMRLHRFLRLKKLLHAMGVIPKELWHFNLPVVTLQGDDESVLKELMGDGPNWKNIAVDVPHSLVHKEAVIIVSSTRLFEDWEEGRDREPPLYLYGKLVICFNPDNRDQERARMTMGPYLRKYEPTDFVMMAKMFLGNGDLSPPVVLTV